MHQILWWKTSISHQQRVPHSSLFRHKSQLAILESNQGELKGQKQFFIINLSVCKLKLYAREGAALTARRKRKGKKASEKKKKRK